MSLQIRKKRYALQRKYVDMKWKTIQAGQQWDPSYEAQLNDLVNKLLQLETAVAQKIDLIQKPDGSEGVLQFNRSYYVWPHRGRVVRYIQLMHRRLAA